MGKKEKQKKETRRTRIAQREHRGVYGQQTHRGGISRREQEEIADHLQDIMASPERLEENLNLLEELFETDEELRTFRFEARETLTLALRNGLLEESARDDEELREERIGKVLENLVTPTFAREVSQAVQKGAQRRRHENWDEATALYLARVFLDARLPNLKLADNPVWTLILRLSLSEAMERAKELGVELPERIEEAAAAARLEELEKYLDSDMLHEELDRLLEEHPEILEDHEDFPVDTAQNVIELAWSGGLDFRFEFPEVLHAPLPLSELVADLRQLAGLEAEADLQPEERSLEVLQECWAADLTDALTERWETWLDRQIESPDETGREHLLATAWQMTEMFDPEDNPLYLALYYASLLAASETSPEGYEEEVEAILRDPSNVEAYLDYGDALLKHTQPEYAIRAFERGLELDPDDFAGHEGLARCYRELGRLDDARREMEQALELATSEAAADPEAGLEAALTEMEEFLQELGPLRNEVPDYPPDEDDEDDEDGEDDEEAAGD